MHVRRFVLAASSLAIILLAVTSVASATSYSFSSVIAYGDSLSDNGNLYQLVGYPPAPYFNGRFSDGPVAVEQFASHFGATLFDFAVGGATTGVGNYVDGGTQTAPGAFGLPGMQGELANTTSILPAIAPGALGFVWGGANDFFSGGSPNVAAANIDAIVIQLQGAGVQYILVPGIPDLGLTPDFHGTALEGLATGYSAAFNAAMQAGLPPGAIYVDTFGLIHQIAANPAAFGFTNVTDPCFNGVSVCSDPSQYLFWDGVHPTTAADAILEDSFSHAVTPEPSMFLLMGTGILGILFMVRRATAYRNS